MGRHTLNESNWTRRRGPFFYCSWRREIIVFHEILRYVYTQQKQHRQLRIACCSLKKGAPKQTILPGYSYVILLHIRDPGRCDFLRLYK